MAKHKMVDMKRSKASKKEHDSPKGLEGDDYPYGLTVSIDHDGMSKLGLGKMPKVGDKIMLHSHAHVKSTSEHHRDGKKHRNMELELRHMSLEHGQKREGDSGTDNDEDDDADGFSKGMKGAMDKALGSKKGKERDPGEDKE